MIGNIRKLDKQGRIVIPKTLCKALGIEAGTKLNIYAREMPKGEPPVIIVRKAKI